METEMTVLSRVRLIRKEAQQVNGKVLCSVVAVYNGIMRNNRVRRAGELKVMGVIPIASFKAEMQDYLPKVISIKDGKHGEDLWAAEWSPNDRVIAVSTNSQGPQKLLLP